MNQKCEYNICHEIIDLLMNYNKRAIRSTTDYQIVTIGRVQIENLDWRWVVEDLDLRSVLHHDPFDWMFRNLGDGTGSFQITKYGLGYREKPLTVASYKPLWAPGTPPDEQMKIMNQEMQKMQKYGTKKCENGIEVGPESPLWTSVHYLSTQARNTFRNSLGQKVKELEAKGISYNAEKLWDAGAPVTKDIVGELWNLRRKMEK